MSRQNDPKSSSLRLDASDGQACNADYHADGLQQALPSDRRSAVWDGNARSDSSIPTPDEPNETARALLGRREHASRARPADGGDIRENGGGERTSGPCFDQAVSPGGYAWWYLDAISDEKEFAVTLIAFVGSVFSPYYAWSKAQQPDDHCAVNIALYGPRANRWAMTERRTGALQRDASNIQIGPSHLRWENGALVADLHERGAPLPFPIRGQIRATPETQTSQRFQLDRNARHTWHPYAPRVRIELSFTEPSLSWSGWGYMDRNFGSARLEHDFHSWDWSRSHFDNGSAILYDASGLNARPTPLAIWMNADGSLVEFEPPNKQQLPSTLWRIRRQTQVDEGRKASVIRTLEDTPFYARSTIETSLLGRQCMAVHETLMLDRLSNPIVKAMLPFRMPRVFWKP